jgi:hypothetical protein
MYHIVEKRRELNLPTFLLFINYGKAYGGVNKEIQYIAGFKRR